MKAINNDALSGRMTLMNSKYNHKSYFFEICCSHLSVKILQCTCVIRFMYIYPLMYRVHPIFPGEFIRICLRFFVQLLNFACPRAGKYRWLDVYLMLRHSCDAEFSEKLGAVREMHYVKLWPCPLIMGDYAIVLTINRAMLHRNFW